MTYLTPFTPYSPPRRGDTLRSHPLPYGGENNVTRRRETILPPEKGVRSVLQVRTKERSENDCKREAK